MTDVIRLTEMGAHAGADFTMPGAEAHYPPDIELEPVHLDIALRILAVSTRSKEATSPEEHRHG